MRGKILSRLKRGQREQRREGFWVKRESGGLVASGWWLVASKTDRGQVEGVVCQVRSSVEQGMVWEMVGGGFGRLIAARDYLSEARANVAFGQAEVAPGGTRQFGRLVSTCLSEATRNSKSCVAAR